MKQIICFVVFVISNFFIHAQSYMGFHTDNFSGIHAALSNPANLSGNLLKYDVNLASVDFLFSNDFLRIDLKDIERLSGTTSADNNNLIIDSDILGPSFFMNIKTKAAIGFFTRARVMSNIVSLDGQLIETLLEGFDDQQQSIYVTEDGFGIVSHAWAEIGISYGGTLLEKERHYLKGGLTVKYLSGMGLSIIRSDGVLVDYNSDLENINTAGSLVYITSDDFIGSGNLISNYADNFGKSSGIGMDLGFIYEHRLKNQSAYLYKMGISIVDIGRVTYKNAETQNFNLNKNNIHENDFALQNGESLEELLERIYGKFITSTNKTRVHLPMSLQAQADVKIMSKFFINTSINVGLTQPKTNNVSKSLTNISITPRYESLLFSVWSPVGLDQYGNFKWGAGFRLGPFFIGSGSIITNLISNAKTIDFYSGLKIPILKRREKPQKISETTIEIKETVPESIENEDDISRMDTNESLDSVSEIDFDVYFENNSIAIIPESLLTLEQKAVLMKKAIEIDSANRFYITGYTDSKGGVAYNQLLSMKRAQAVKVILKNYGIPSLYMQTGGKGETDLKCEPELEEKDYQCNRRVEIHMIK